MRVVVACGGFRNLSSAQTGTALARAWAELGCACAVVPMAEAGRAFEEAWRDLGSPGVVVTVDEQELAADSSWALGVRLREVLSLGDGGGALLLEVPAGVDVAWHDGGAGLLAALGATADRALDAGVEALRGLSRLDLQPVRSLLAGRRVRLVVDSRQQQLALTGLRGITSVLRDRRGETPEQMLATDQALVDLAEAAGQGELATRPGTGAAGGVGFIAHLLGGDVVTGPQLLAEAARLPETIAKADLVVTGCDELEFGTKGGDLLPLVTGLAEQAMRPAVAVARRNWISARELRTMGLEEGYTLARDDEDLDADQITRAALPCARTWSWSTAR